MTTTTEVAETTAIPWLKKPKFWLWLCLVAFVFFPLFGLFGWHYYIGRQVVGRRGVGVGFAHTSIMTRVSALRPLARIQYVVIGDSANADQIIPWLSFQPNLTRLELRNERLSLQTMATISASCPKLEELVIESDSSPFNFLPLTEVDRAKLTRLNHLRQLRVFVTGTADGYAACAAKCPRLETLHMEGWFGKKLSLSANGCEQIAQLRDLRKLTMIADIVGDGFERLARLPSLREFEYFPKTFGKHLPEHIAGLGRFEHVESLRVNLTDAELRTALADRSDGGPVLPRLKHLALTPWGHYGPQEYRLSVSTAKSLATLSTLESLNLTSIKVSIRGVRELTTLPRLRSLTIGKDSCTKEEIDSLPPTFLSRCRIRQENDEY